MMGSRILWARTRTVLIAVAVTFATSFARGNATEPAEDLVGLWRAQRDFGPEVAGELLIVNRSGTWSAHIAGFSAPVTTEGGSVMFAVAGDRGSFRGKLVEAEGTIRGHWIQPPTAANFVRFATPVTLTRQASDSYRGHVEPLDDKMTFYLVLKRREDGTAYGFLRNPEANFGRHFHIEQVLRDGDQVRFVEPEIPDARLQGTFYDDDRFSIFIPDAGGTFDFDRVTDDTASPFYARAKDAAPYEYSPPTARDDGWQVGTLEEVGMSVPRIEDMLRLIIETPIDAIDAHDVHAVLIARHGKIVLEEYFHGHTVDTPHDTRSASKTVTSTLVGLAIQAGEPLAPSTLVYDTMYEGQLPADIDPRKRRMTLEHLLTMTPGLACDDNDENSPGAEWKMQSQEDPDWLRYTLELPMVHEPGEVVAYCSASPNLAGGMLSKVTGSWLPGLFEKYFARPMQMSTYHMNLMPTGDAYGGGGLYITGRDFLKMGQVFLDEGRWNGTRLLSDEWVRDAVTPVQHLFDQGYGYAWWILELPYENRTVQAFYAGGNGGQYVIGIPELDMSIVFFGGNYNQRILHLIKQKHVPEYILRAVASETDPSAD